MAESWRDFWRAELVAWVSHRHELCEHVTAEREERCKGECCAPPKHGIKTQEKPWVGSYAWNQSTLLKDWTAYQGNGSIWTYQSDGVPLTQGNDVTLQRVTDYKPYIQANATLPGRPETGTTQREAYFFYLNIYKGNGNTPAVKDYSWDPYVTVYQP